MKGKLEMQLQKTPVGNLPESVYLEINWSHWDSDSLARLAKSDLKKNYLDSRVYAITRLRIYAITRLRDYTIMRLRDYTITRLRDYAIKWLPIYAKL